MFHSLFYFREMISILFYEMFQLKVGRISKNTHLYKQFTSYSSSFSCMCAVKAVRYRVILLLLGVKLEIEHYVTVLLTWLVDLLLEYFLDIFKEEFLSDVVAYVIVGYSTKHWTRVLTSYFVVIERPFQVSAIDLTCNSHFWYYYV